MTTPLNDVYQLNLFGSTDAGEVLNVFFYERDHAPVSTLTDDLVDFVDSFHTSTWAAIQAIISGVYTLVHIEALDLFDVGGFADVAYVGEHGSVGSDAMGPFSAWAFHTNIIERGIRRGQKRFGPVNPASVSADGVASGGAVALLEALEDQLGAILPGIADATQSWTPVIVKRILVSAGPPRNYRLPATLAEAEVADSVDQWSYVRLSTQNTRKVGRGS